MEAAAKAAPYVQPRVAAIEHTGGDGGPIRVELPPDLAELTREERAILRQLLEWRLRNDAREEDQPGPDALDPAGSPPWRRGPPSR
jgi:hypothetical protein